MDLAVQFWKINIQGSEDHAMTAEVSPWDQEILMKLVVPITVEMRFPEMSY